MHCSLRSFSGSLSDIFSAYLYVNCIAQHLFVLNAFLLWTVQVIYKKFNIRCPFTDFGNGTAIRLNVSAMDPGGEEDPACIPKMVNLNSQVGLRMSLSLKLQMHLHCHGHWQPPTYVIVIFSMLPETIQKPSMEVTLGLKHSFAP